MPKPEIEEFGRLLVQHVRDMAIPECTMDLSPSAQSVVAKRWRAVSAQNADALGKEIIPDVVDDAIFYLLHAIDEGKLKLSFVASNGKTIDLTEEGLSELAGWYMGSGGWRAKYSKERYTDDFSDLGK